MNKTIAKVAVEVYTGRKMASVLVYQDSTVQSTWAIRAVTLDDGETLDFLVCDVLQGAGSAQISDALEECNFESWPPKSGGTKIVF